jgi:hypothetical protein
MRQSKKKNTKKASIRRKKRYSRKLKQTGGVDIAAPPPPYTAVLVEPRKHAAAKFVLRNLLDNLEASKWKILVLHGNKNAEWLKTLLPSIVHNEAERSRITLQNLNKDTWSHTEYNRMLKTKEFYEKIPTELFLLVQTDSMICPNNKDLINKFLKYDYVGAPWKASNEVGNGGFSLRRKSKMIELIHKCPEPIGQNNNEDIYFSRGCSQMQLYKPSVEEAKEFAIETMESEKSFGIHKSWAHVGDQEKVCPGVRELSGLQREE